MQNSHIDYIAQRVMELIVGNGADIIEAFEGSSSADNGNRQVRISLGVQYKETAPGKGELKTRISFAKAKISETEKHLIDDKQLALFMKDVK